MEAVHYAGMMNMGVEEASLPTLSLVVSGHEEPKNALSRQLAAANVLTITGATPAGVSKAELVQHFVW